MPCTDRIICWYDNLIGNVAVHVVTEMNTWISYQLKKVLGHSLNNGLTVCTSISPVGCCALVSGFAGGPSGPLVAQAMCTHCAAIRWEWTTGPGPVGQAFTWRQTYQHTGHLVTETQRMGKSKNQDGRAETVAVRSQKKCNLLIKDPKPC